MLFWNRLWIRLKYFLNLFYSTSSQLGLLMILVCLWVLLANLSPGFLSRLNLNSLGRSLAIDIVIGFSQMVVMVTGGMNISVGAIGVCSVMIMGYLLQSMDMPIPIGILSALFMGAVLGWLNGMTIVKTGVNSFIVTLASASIFSGSMLIITKGVSFNKLPPELGAFGRNHVAGVPTLIILALIIGVVLIVFYKYMRTGREILAVGANSRAAELSGISVGRMITLSHVLSGLLAAMAGVMLTARLGAALTSVGGDDWLLPSFLAPILGGTLQSGGIISVFGSMLGATLVTTIRSGLLVLQVGNFWFQLFLGVILLMAVLLNRYRTNISIKRQTHRL